MGRHRYYRKQCNPTRIKKTSLHLLTSHHITLSPKTLTEINLIINSAKQSSHSPKQKQLSATNEQEHENSPSAHSTKSHDHLHVLKEKAHKSVVHSDSDTWLAIGNIILTKKERNDLTNGKVLNDLHINAFQLLLKQNSPNVTGFQDTLKQNKSPLNNLKDTALQIIHIRGFHWAALKISSNNVYVYDSSYSTLSEDAQHIIATLLNSKDDSITAQTGTVDCALFAMAYVTHLANGKDPTTVVFNQHELRPHLLKTFESGKVAPFPVLKTQRPSKQHKREAIQIYCYCRLPDHGELMICCDECNKWFHKECVMGDKDRVSLEEKSSWVCGNCIQTA